MGRADAVYAKLPVWGQHLAVSGFGIYWHWLRFGPGFKREVEIYRGRERLTPAEWKELQRALLVEQLSNAASRVPYYRDTWTNAEKAAAHAGRLLDIPLLEKDPLRADARRFLRSDQRPSRELVFHTSGSTGTPIASIWTIPELRRSRALREVRSAGWAGVSFEMPRGTFSGRIVEPDPNSRGPFYRFNAVEKQVYLSAFHLRAENAQAYVDAFRRHRTRWLTGYAVSFHLLAEYILEQNIEVPPLSAVITTSEKLTEKMRTTMEAAYQCRVYEEYSTVENALFASECEQGRLHSSPDVAVVEILRPDGTPADPGEVGEVVATCLCRTYQPLIRFRLGDMAAWDREPCPCGSGMPVLKEVVGRIEDVVVGPDGRKMVRFHGIFVDQPNVREAQVIQERKDKIRIKVVPTPQFGPDDERDIVARIHQRLSDAMNVEVELVSEIPRTKAGKLKAVISLMEGE